MNYNRFLTAVAKARQPSILREMTAMLANASPELVYLAGGLPNPSLFPFDSASIKLKDGSELQIDQEKMKTALQYGPTYGFGPLVKFLKNLTEELHKPPNWSKSELIVTSGSQDGLCKSFEMFIGANDSVLVQEPCYTGTLAILKPLTSNVIGVASDNEGLLPSSLRDHLSKWSHKEWAADAPGLPKVLYLNPAGNNPTGSIMTNQRRKEVYNIACEYNLLLLEDDPYYFVQFSDQEAPKSFLEMDVQGRVLRFDSVSKILSSGIRLGFVSGPQQLIYRIMLHMQVSLLQTSYLSQVVVSELLEKWGMEGFLQHTKKVQNFYASQRDAMVEAANAHLSGLCKWSVPDAGMFLWIEVTGLKDTHRMVMEQGIANDVMVVPGSYFLADSSQPSPYIRVAFSVTPPDRMHVGMDRLARVIRSEKSKQNLM